MSTGTGIAAEPQDTASPRSAKAATDAASGFQRNVIAFFAVATVVFIGGISIAGSRAPTVSLTEHDLTVRGAGSSVVVPRADIDSVRLVRDLPGIGLRQSGFNAGNTFAGRFPVRGYGVVALYINTTTPPHIVVYARSGITIFDARQAAETQRLFAGLSAR